MTVFDATILFIISMTAGTAIILLSAASYNSSRFNFWPPPNKSSWEINLFWTLFCLFSFPLFTLVFLEFDERNSNTIFFLIGSTLSFSGLVLANTISYNLGFKNTSGQKDELRTKGWYSVSRNPVYVTTIISLAGTIIAIPTFNIIAISSLWILIYILAPFLEEPWLEKIYGNEYLDYKNNVRRFI